MNKKIVIFDPPMCCSSGVCGPNPDQTLIEFQDMFKKLKQSGQDIERYIITQSPDKFKDNPQIIKLIQEKQLKVLPITTVNGVVVKTGGYPTMKDLDISDSDFVDNKKNCCIDKECLDGKCKPGSADCCSNSNGGNCC